MPSTNVVVFGCNYYTQLEDWLEANDAYTAAQIRDRAATNATWYQLELLYAQYEGIIAGYAATAPDSAQLMRVAFRNMQIGGDLESLSSAVTALSDRNLTAADLIPSDSMRRWLGIQVDERGAVADSNGGHCSALVKLLEDDVVIAQATWGSLEGMTRVYKRYDLPFFTVPGSLNRVPAVSTWFSSYPATLFSGDDWYMTSAGEGMVVLETTIGNSNPALWKHVQPRCILEWARNVIANRLGSSGEMWAETFSQENSGTYNNEFIVMDNSRITLGGSSGPVELRDGAITMLDQLPGYIEFHDVTERLRTESYIPSYNVPAFHDVWVMSGLQPMEEKYGPWFSYNGTARGLMFRRNQSTITSVDGVRALMRYNDFQHDPISTQGQVGRIPPFTAENAIACRDDLNPADGNYSISAFGFRDHVETDCKLTSAKLMRGQAVLSESTGDMVGGAAPFASMIISGPTHQGAMPPFQFSKSAFKTPPAHTGLPDVFAFDWTVAAL